jgi:nitroimidazol reductase NimA-like FMN-containing flavoprotein (pyridoxamine 5'-phosphate oxidase superfamily)
MTESVTRTAILEEACRIAAPQLGGTLATMHAEDGTPYVTFVFFHLSANGEVVFGSAHGPQHARNIAATPEVSFLIDNREVIRDDWTSFDRIVIEGRAAPLLDNEPGYAGHLHELEAKNKMAAYFTKQGQMYIIRPRRLILMKGIEPGKQIIEFERD